MTKRKIILTAGVAIGLMAASFISEYASAAAMGKTVEFNAAMTPPSPLRQQMAKKMGSAVKVYPTPRIKSVLYAGKPNGAGVILLPGCLGVQKFHHAWAQRLTDWGYTALIVNSAGSRGMKENCPGENLMGYREARLGERVYDIYGAHAFLKNKQGIDPKRIALMGWGYNDLLASILETGVQRFFDAPIAAAVAYYPACRTTPTGKFIAPLLLMTGANDDWSPAARCRRMAEAGADGPSKIDLVIYDDTQHGFDNTALKKQILRPDVWNPNKHPTKSATLQYNKASSADAQARVKSFFEQNL